MKMGFEPDRRIRKEYKNRRVTATVGGQTCSFRSLFEWRWTQYLQILKDSAQIATWTYEPTTFYFYGVKSAPHKYTPDFYIKMYALDKVPNYWQECKGHHDGPTNSKLRRMAEHYPDEIMELVLQGFSKKTAQRRDTAARYTRRIIDGNEILRQVRGLIQWEPIDF